MSDGGFTLQALWALRDDRTLDSADWKVAVALVSFCNEQGFCRPSLGALAAVARTSRGAVRRSLERLERKAGPLTLGIERARRTDSGDSDTHRYHLALRGCDQVIPGCDQQSPTPDHTDPTVGSPEPNGCDQGNPTGVIKGAHEEDIQEDIQEDKEELARVRADFDYWASNLWGKIHASKPKANDSRLKHFRARCREGFTHEQLCAVVDHVAANDFMMGRSEKNSRPYIEPKNFMATREKFESWLAAKPKPGIQAPQRGGMDESLIDQARARGAVGGVK